MPPNPYTTSTVDSDDYKSLLCGRSEHLAMLLEEVKQGHSIALCGERRIGKTSLLQLLRDIINGQIDTYAPQLIDLDLKNGLASLKASVPAHCKAVYLSLQDVGKTHGELAHALQNVLHKAGCLHSSFMVGTMQAAHVAQPQHYATVTEVLQALHTTTSTEKFVLLLDEMEGLQQFAESTLIAQNLRGIITACPRISMILVGTEGWYRELQDKSSPLAFNTHLRYLKRPARDPLETYLVTGQLSKHLPAGYDATAMVQCIMEWSGGKPYYVQAICYEIVVKVCNVPEQLDGDTWKQTVKDAVFEAHGKILQDFYQGANLDEQAKGLLALLANRPGLRVEQMAQWPGNTLKKTRAKIADFGSFDKVSKHAGTRGETYRLIGTLIEEWGHRYLDEPARQPAWLRPLKWTAAAVLLLLALGAYIYTHPNTQTFSFSMLNGFVTLQMPASVEQSETGKAIVTVQNTGTSPLTVHVFLTAPGITYQLKGSDSSNDTNQLIFTKLTPGEKQVVQPTYTIDDASGFPPASLTSQIQITQDGTAKVVTKNFMTAERVFPLQQWWYAFSGLFIALGAFINKNDLWQLVTNLLSLFTKKPDASGVQAS